MLLVLLQNAWSRWYQRIGKPGEDGHRLRDKVWHREDWIDATWSSRSGQRLMQILKDVPEELIWLDNTTLEVAGKSSGVKVSDLDHIQIVIANQSISWVVACGNQAGSAIDRVWTGPLIKIPHPAHRTINDFAIKAFNVHVRCMMAQTSPYRCRVDTWGNTQEA